MAKVPICLSLPSSPLLDRVQIFEEMFISQELFDVEIHCSDSSNQNGTPRSLRAHRVVLAAVSPVLRRMLTGQFIEAGQAAINVDFDLWAMEKTLELIYIGSTNVDSVEEIVRLGQVADHLDIEKLREFALKTASGLLSVESCAVLFQVANTSGLGILEEKAKDFFCRRFCEVATTEGFLSVDEASAPCASLPFLKSQLEIFISGGAGLGARKRRPVRAKRGGRVRAPGALDDGSQTANCGCRRGRIFRQHGGVVSAATPARAAGPPAAPPYPIPAYGRCAPRLSPALPPQCSSPRAIAGGRGAAPSVPADCQPSMAFFWSSAADRGIDGREAARLSQRIPRHDRTRFSRPPIRCRLPAIGGWGAACPLRPIASRRPGRGMAWGGRLDNRGAARGACGASPTRARRRQASTWRSTSTRGRAPWPRRPSSRTSPPRSRTWRTCSSP